MPINIISEKTRIMYMKNKVIVPTSNISEGVEFFLRGARKRRSMAIASVRQVNADMGVNLRLVSVK